LTATKNVSQDEVDSMLDPMLVSSTARRTPDRLAACGEILARRHVHDTRDQPRFAGKGVVVDSSTIDDFHLPNDIIGLGEEPIHYQSTNVSRRTENCEVKRH
jgi:hypothetical protein